MLIQGRRQLTSFLQRTTLSILYKGMSSWDYLPLPFVLGTPQFQRIYHCKKRYFWKKKTLFSVFSLFLVPFRQFLALFDRVFNTLSYKNTILSSCGWNFSKVKVRVSRWSRSLGAFSKTKRVSGYCDRLSQKYRISYILFQCYAVIPPYWRK